MKYGVILLDPPWTFETRSKVNQNRSAENHYGCMTLSDIYQIPLSKIAAKDCMMLLWVTRPHLENAFAFLNAQNIQNDGRFKKVSERWKYSTMVDWVKMKNGKLQTGTGYRARDSSEVLIIATRGTVKLQPPAMRQPSTIVAPRTRHSEKPYQQYLYARGVPGPYLEIFARKNRNDELLDDMPEWDYIGLEYTGNDVNDDIETLAGIEQPTHLSKNGNLYTQAEWNHYFTPMDNAQYNDFIAQFMNKLDKS